MVNTIPGTAAGRFYPSQAGELRHEIDAYLAAAPTVCRPKAIISPHAGYGYSGMLLGYAYKSVQPLSDSYHRVLLLGTCHARSVQGLASTSATTMETPLGDVPVDRAAVDHARRILPERVEFNDSAHAVDHSLQTQLPFLQVALDSFSVAPFLVGTTDDLLVGDLITALGESPEVLVVVSSDLSHYLDYDTCVRVDQQTAEAIVALDAASIGPEQACGHVAIRGLIHAATCLRWSPRLLVLKNSGDTIGDRARVVGYGAFAMELIESRGGGDRDAK